MRDLLTLFADIAARRPRLPDTVSWPAAATGPAAGRRADDRGISEAIGYVLVFSLVIMTIATVGTLGIGQLETVREYERMNNMERSFGVMATNVDEIVLDGAPSRATEVKLGGGTVATADPITITVAGTHSSDPTLDFSVQYDVSPIVYGDSSGNQVVYTGGALFRQHPDGTAVVRGPPGIYGTERTVVPIVQMRSDDVSSVTGDVTVLVRAQHSQTEQIVGTGEGTFDLTVTVESPRAEAWGDYFESQGFTCVLTTPTTASCSLTNIDRLHVTVVRIDVTME